MELADLTSPRLWVSLGSSFLFTTGPRTIQLTQFSSNFNEDFCICLKTHDLCALSFLFLWFLCSTLWLCHAVQGGNDGSTLTHWGSPGTSTCSLIQEAGFYRNIEFSYHIKMLLTLYQIHACGPPVGRALFMDEKELILPPATIHSYLRKSRIWFVLGSIHPFNEYSPSTFQVPHTVQVLSTWLDCLVIYTLSP